LPFFVEYSKVLLFAGSDSYLCPSETKMSSNLRGGVPLPWSASRSFIIIMMMHCACLELLAGQALWAQAEPALDAASSDAQKAQKAYAKRHGMKWS
jgi:hypothetical protein